MAEGKRVRASVSPWSAGKRSVAAADAAGKPADAKASKPARSAGAATSRRTPATRTNVTTPRTSFVRSAGAVKNTGAKTFAPRKIGPAVSDGNSVVISHRAAERLRAGHAWVYRSDIEALPKSIAAGSLVALTDRRGTNAGVAMYSAASQIALRLFWRGAEVAAVPSRDEFCAAIASRVEAAARLRVPMLTNETDSARIVFSEADRLPGLIIDRYAGIVVVQRNTQGLMGDDVAEAITRGLLAGFGEHAPAAIVERPDARMRELEELPAPAAEAWFTGSAIARDVHTSSPHPHGAEVSADIVADAPELRLNTEFHLNGLRFAFDANAGQKTGAFLDQRENYAAAARHAASAPPVDGVRRALDICTYQGGFALHLAQVCDAVVGVDASIAALEVAQRNEHTNRESLHAGEIDWLQADAFQLLRGYADAGERFSAIVLDPPAFAKSVRAAEGALRGYKEMNLRAIQMLVPGGVLVTCSCSHHVGLPEFTEAVAAAAADAGRRVTLLESRTAAADHPVVLGLPETFYLKCLICRVD